MNVNTPFALPVLGTAQVAADDGRAERSSNPDRKGEMFFGCTKAVFEVSGRGTNAARSSLDLESKIGGLFLDIFQISVAVAFVNIKIGKQDGIQPEGGGII